MGGKNSELRPNNFKAATAYKIYSDSPSYAATSNADIVLVKHRNGTLWTLQLSTCLFTNDNGGQVNSPNLLDRARNKITNSGDAISLVQQFKRHIESNPAQKFDKVLKFE